MILYILNLITVFVPSSAVLEGLDNKNLLKMMPFWLDLSVVGISCIINLLIYFIILKLLENPKITIWIEKKTAKYNFIKKIFNFYKKTRILVIIYELFVLFIILLFFVWCFINILINYEKFI